LLLGPLTNLEPTTSAHFVSEPELLGPSALPLAHLFKVGYAALEVAPSPPASSSVISD